MKPWLIPTIMLLAGTVLAAGAAWGLNLGLNALIAPSGDVELREAARRSPPSTQAPPEELDTESPQGAVPKPPRRAPKITRKEYISTIVRRNIFDHQNVGQEYTSPDDPTGDGAGRVQSVLEPCEDEECEEVGEKSDLPVSLLGTVVVNPTAYSSALIMNNNSKEIRAYAVGDKLLDSTIASIQVRRVVVQRDDGNREYISLDDEERPTRTAAAKPSGTGDDQIMQDGEDSYVIDRQLFDESMQDLDALSRMARAIPHRNSDGQPDGFRLSGVRRNELLYKLGIRSGDIVHGVNGQPLTSIAEAMNAMQTLQRESSFTFEVTRRGQKKTMSYQVR